MRLQNNTWAHYALSLAVLTGTAGATAAVTSPPEVARRQSSPSITAVSACHMHETVQYCMVGTAEYRIMATTTTDLPSSYTDCHAHAAETWCMNPNGGEVEVVAAETAAPSLTAVTDCRLAETEVICSADATEYRVDTTATATQDIPPSFTGCHPHGSDTYCLSPSGDDVQVALASGEDEVDADEAEPEGLDCHFHAGVEHCLAPGETEGGSSTVSCERPDREYNVPLRVGLLFAILVTSAIGVFAPIVLARFMDARAGTILLVIKQFGTGVIMSTALVHLFTHAELMFGSACLGALKYEATTASIVMAGLFLSFLLEYLGYRYVKWQARKKAGSLVPTPEGLKSVEMVSIYIMEAGIVFHSVIIGVTLVVAGDSFLLTLFVVIIFHQMFEGLALGSRIAALGTGQPNPILAVLGHSHGSGHGHGHDYSKTAAGGSEETTATTTKHDGGEGVQQAENGAALFRVSMAKKISLAVAFSLVTPLGMAIGIGVLGTFNGNDPETIVAIGTLDAFSAGILLWVGVVEMWAADWVFGGGMTEASALVTCLGLGGLVSGMVVMSVLGKWA
ncbi:Zip-domain-containing protein [Parathielavia hyrcaniae]|uniref:Zip-domain-containing protein n=1 Tax=Parathielavia hyrcaniae TaxID=113614 RepID=A0AAN6T459_9PEZI|nr:Zip-domain-containing protein [Parathielavia hyrcaniae]